MFVESDLTFFLSKSEFPRETGSAIMLFPVRIRRNPKTVFIFCVVIVIFIIFQFCEREMVDEHTFYVS